MSIAALAERIAACEAARSRARRQILTLVPVLALAGAGLGFLLFGGAGTALALPCRGGLRSGRRGPRSSRPGGGRRASRSSIPISIRPRSNATAW